MADRVLTERERFFWLNSGRPLRSIRELADALPSIPEEEFSYHASPQRNDFANWVEDLFDERQLGAELRKATKKSQFQTILYNFFIQREQGSKRGGESKKDSNRVDGDASVRPEEALRVDSRGEGVSPATAKDELKSATREKGGASANPFPSIGKLKRGAKPRSEDASSRFSSAAALRGMQKNYPKGVLVKDPERFAEFREADAEEKDAIADRFDGLARRMAESLEEELPDVVQEEIEALNMRYASLRQAIAETRKSGKDPLFAEFHLRAIPAKIAYARVTGSKHDIFQIREIFNIVEKELEEEKQREEPDVKRDVEALVAAPSSSGGGRTEGLRSAEQAAEGDA